MNNTSLRLFLLFLLLILLQIGILNQIHLFSFATPLLYIYFLLKLPVDMNRNTVLLLGFVMGFIIDIFCYTLGINMLAMTIIGFLRFYFIPIFGPRDVLESSLPSFATFGKSQFMSYAGFMTFIHHVIVYAGESFSMLDLLSFIFKVLSSFVLTLLLIFAFESVNLNWGKSEK